jgi:spore germination protein Q
MNYQQPYSMPYGGYNVPYQMPQQQYQPQPMYPVQPPMQQFPAQPPFQPFPPMGSQPLPFVEQSFIENILRLNKGKIATVYMNFEGSQWGSKIFKGEILSAGKDHIILRDPQTDVRYLLLSIYLSYITFDEEINYEYPFAGA